MNPKIEKVASELKQKLSLNDEIESANPLEFYNSENKIIENAIAELKEFIESHRFENNEEEIEFFKKIKPEMISFKIEQGLRYNLIINKPIGTNKGQARYFEEELKTFQSFLRLNAFHYQYFKNEYKELDHLYFIRNSGPLSIPIPETPDSDDDFSTPMSYLFAKFMAYERIQYFIIKQISSLQTRDLAGTPNIPDENAELKWTGDIINLVELAYGIWLTGQMNNGNASLSQIVRWLETNLSVTIGIIQRRFAEIERRKRLSTTKFVDQMKNAILKKIESNNE
jgi:hypothetical protein